MAFAVLVAGIVAESVAASWIHYDWFEYEGRDPVYAEHAAEEGQFHNPILPGFYPDPSVVSVDGVHYLVNSTFAYFPGVPIFRSHDLVHWEQIGHVLDRPSQLNLDGHRTSRGIFAPTISFHAGIYYMVTTLVDTAGNFFVTAKDPAGPWSEPVLLPEVDGIDPSLFFDDDGRAWLVNNGPPPDDEPLYEGHRAIWIQEFDVGTQRLVGPRKIIINGGVELSERPVWIEGPHIFKRGDWYYLHCAEGGTSVDHRQVVFRSRQPDGPYEPWEGNPILTQRLLPADRDHPVAATGHADLVELENDEWWAVFLGVRPYERDYYNTGRETFLLPVTWTEDDWPMILPVDQAVPLVLDGPARMANPGPRIMPQGNFIWRDDFNDSRLRDEWVMLRTPRGDPWWRMGSPVGVLSLKPRTAPLTDHERQPSFLGRRQQHQHFHATTALSVPLEAVVEAGLVCYLDETHYYFFGVRRNEAGVTVILERADGKVEELQRRVLGEMSSIQLRVAGEPGRYTFTYSTDGKEWSAFDPVDGRILTTAQSWGFTGVMIGPHARRSERE